jgi:hypothetical protein
MQTRKLRGKSGRKYLILHVADIHALYQSKMIRNEYCPWLNNDIRKLSYRRDYFKIKTVIKLNSATYHEAYKKRKIKSRYQIIKEYKSTYIIKKSGKY